MVDGCLTLSYVHLRSFTPVTSYPGFMLRSNPSAMLSVVIAPTLLLITNALKTDTGRDIQIDGWTERERKTTRQHNNNWMSWVQPVI